MCPTLIQTLPLMCRLVAESPQVERFIHFSDMGADLQHASKRLASKAKGDKAIMELCPHATIVKCVGCD